MDQPTDIAGQRHARHERVEGARGDRASPRPTKEGAPGAPKSEDSYPAQSPSMRTHGPRSLLRDTSALAFGSVVSGLLAYVFFAKQLGLP